MFSPASGKFYAHILYLLLFIFIYIYICGKMGLREIRPKYAKKYGPHNFPGDKKKRSVLAKMLKLCGKCGEMRLWKICGEEMQENANRVIPSPPP